MSFYRLTWISKRVNYQLWSLAAKFNENMIRTAINREIVAIQHTKRGIQKLPEKSYFSKKTIKIWSPKSYKLAVIHLYSKKTLTYVCKIGKPPKYLWVVHEHLVVIVMIVKNLFMFITNYIWSIFYQHLYLIGRYKYRRSLS